MGEGATTTECTPSGSRAREKARAKATETVTTAARLCIFPESAPIRRKTKARAEDSKETAIIVEKQVTLRVSARKVKEVANPRERGAGAKEKRYFEEKTN